MQTKQHDFETVKISENSQNIQSNGDQKTDENENKVDDTNKLLISKIDYENILTLLI